jgi:hypothetical protein
MTLMATEKPVAAIRFTKRHPITGRRPSYRDWWFEHEGVVFHISADSLRDMWTVEPDTTHTRGSQALLDFIGSDVYWCSLVFRLSEARAALAEFIASDRFAALRDAYTKLLVDIDYRQVAWDPSSPVQFHRDR